MFSTPISETLSQYASIRHGFFTREVGDCGWPRGAGEGAEIARNRGKVALALGVPPERLVSCKQIHSDKAITLGPEGFPNGIVPEADAMVTNHPRLALGILTADCAPILLADPEAQVIGAAHAGWRGAIGGVLENTLTAMEKLGAKRKRTLAVLGPCIGPKSYEVGPEFPAPFLAENRENEQFFRPALSRYCEEAKPTNQSRATKDKLGDTGSFRFARDDGEKREENSAMRYLFDLPSYIQNKLQKLGLSSVESSAWDTYADPARFFSYRRACQSGNPVTGRLISAIVLTG